MCRHYGMANFLNHTCPIVSMSINKSQNEYKHANVYLEKTSEVLDKFPEFETEAIKHASFGISGLSIGYLIFKVTEESPSKPLHYNVSFAEGNKEAPAYVLEDLTVPDLGYTAYGITINRTNEEDVSSKELLGDLLNAITSNVLSDEVSPFEERIKLSRNYGKELFDNLRKDESLFYKLSN